MQHKYYFILTAILIATDYITKYLIAFNFDLGDSITIVEGLLNFTYVINTGMAFSILADYQYARYILPMISIIASVIIVWLMLRTNHSKQLLAFSLILAGALGNFIDRAFAGYVIDFIHFYYQEYSFAIFNVADSCITLGVIIMLFIKNHD